MTDILTEENKKKFQERFAHLLRSYRHENDLSQTDLANKIGVTMPLITKFENPRGTANRAISSYEFFMTFASLLDMTFSEIASYLENDGVITKNSPWNSTLSQTIPKIRADIQYKLLKFFSETKTEDLNRDLNFLLGFIRLSNDDKSYLEHTIDRVLRAYPKQKMN